MNSERERSHGPPVKVGALANVIDELPPPFVFGPPLADRLRQHPLVNDRIFFMLPEKLLGLVEKHVKPNPLGPLRELEYTASAMCGDHAQNAGLWNGRLIEYTGLEVPIEIPALTQETLACLGWEQDLAKVTFDLKKGDASLAAFRDVARGYIGWLVTNRQFLAEQSQLMTKWAGQIATDGLRGAGQILLVSDAKGIPGAKPPDTPERNAFHEGIREFLVRWRLVALPAPYLPVPMMPMMAGLFPVSFLPQLMNAGGLFNIPDTFPIPSRDELRQLLTDAIRPGSDATHLQEWHGIVRSSNPAKNRIDRFARIRRLVHYWRVLHERHAIPLHRKKAALSLVFAEFFGVGDDTIKADLSVVSKRLGPDWYQSNVQI